MKTWSCKIGEVEAVPPEVEVRDTSQLSVRWISADQHMRRAVEAAYEELTGQKCTFTFSGWGAELDESERAVVEDREPDYYKTGWLEHRLHELRKYLREGHGGRDEGLPDWSETAWIAAVVIKLGEAALHLHPETLKHAAPKARDVARKVGVENLLATAAACLDAVEAIEARGEEATASEAAPG